LPGEDQAVKYATPLRISQAQSIGKPETSIFKTLTGILQTPFAELALVDIASCFLRLPRTRGDEPDLIICLCGTFLRVNRGHLTF
jgi:hypothetical protein